MSQQHQNKYLSKQSPFTRQNTIQSLNVNRINTQAFVEIMKKADIIDLINLSLNAQEIPEEQIQQFIQRTLDRKFDQNERLRQPIIDSKQLEQIFTPPNKSGSYRHERQSPNQLVRITSDENLNIMIANRFQDENRTLQPSILENATAPTPYNAALKSIQYSLQNQITNSKQQMFEDLQKQLLQKIHLDDSSDFSNQVPRDFVPRPYSEQPTSPSEQNSHQKDQNAIRHYQNQSFSDQDFVQEAISQASHEQTLRAKYEAQQKMDQFSFYLGPVDKKSVASSKYSTLQDGTQASSQNQPSLQSPSKYEHHYEKCNDNSLLHVVKPRTVANYKQQQQQSLASNRCTNGKCLTKSAERSRNFNLRLNTTQSTKDLHRSFINSTKHQDQESRAPRDMSQNNIKAFGNLTQRYDDTESQRGRNSSILKSFSELRRHQQALDPKKQQFLNAFQHMNVMQLIELERIKKPSQLAYITARLIIEFFAIFKEQTQSKSLHMEDLIEWNDIQRYINNNIMKSTNELLSTIKLKVLGSESLPQAQRDAITLQLIQLRQEYFTGENLKLFKHLSTNKTLQVIITFVYKVMSFYLESQLQQHEQKEHEQVFNQTMNSERVNFVAIENSQTQIRSDLGSARKQSKLHQFIVKKDITPTHNNQLLKSSSSCLLQKRSPHISGRNFDNYESKKQLTLIDSDVTNQKQGATTPRLGGTQGVNEPQSIKRTLLVYKHKSKSPLNRSNNINAHLIQSQMPQQLGKTNKITTQQLITPINTHHVVGCSEEPLDLNYQLMIESSTFADLIKKTAVDIEQNMKNSPQRKHIDMGIIQQLKQRRMEQKLRDKSLENQQHV